MRVFCTIWSNFFYVIKLLLYHKKGSNVGTSSDFCGGQKSMRCQNQVDRGRRIFKKGSESGADKEDGVL